MRGERWPSMLTTTGPRQDAIQAGAREAQPQVSGCPRQSGRTLQAGELNHCGDTWLACEPKRGDDLLASRRRCLRQDPVTVNVPFPSMAV
jgi:hypothetical protein